MYMYVYVYVFQNHSGSNLGVGANFGSKSSGLIYAILLNLQKPTKTKGFSMVLQVLEGQVEPC